MDEFLKYVLWELSNSIGFVLVSIITTIVILAVTFTLYKHKNMGERKFPWVKAFLWIIFVGYEAIVVYATILRGGSGHRVWNLHLFRAWREAWNNYSVKNWANVLLNVAMFFPLGFLLPVLKNLFRKWYITIATGCVVSVLIELVQLLLGVGICDVDDLFANFLGTVIGYLTIMIILTVFKKEKKSGLVYGVLLSAIVISVTSIFCIYEFKEYGNLPIAPAYRNNTSNTEWELDCELPAVDAELPVYRTTTRSIRDCDAFAEHIATLDSTAVDMVSYYQDFAYYMLHAEGTGTGVLLVSYYDESYEYSVVGSNHHITAVATDRSTVEAALGKYALLIPKYAEFHVDQDCWHIFTANHIIDGNLMFDGILRCQYLNDGTLRKIENSLLTYEYYDKVNVISPMEAYYALCNGDFYDEGYFEREKPTKVIVQSCGIDYETDTKGFYRPVYVFEVEAENENYHDTIIVPAM